MAKFIRLYLIDKTTVDIRLEEWSGGGGGRPGYGQPEHVFELAKQKGYFAVSSLGYAAGLNGGCGDTQYRVASVVKSEVLDPLDEFHDEGNATNHRLRDCGAHCKE